MKKQVTFAESQTIYRPHHNKALPSTWINESKVALKHVGVNFNSDLKNHGPPAARTEPEIQDITTIQIPKTMTTGSFLKHTALTPAQKEYLYAIAASFSTAHVRNLITQHYMNVLHRCIRTGHSPDRDDPVVTSVTSCEKEKHPSKSQSEVSSRGKHRGKTNTSSQHSGKSFLPKIPNRPPRFSSMSASKRRKMKKHTTTSPKTERSPRMPRIRLVKEEQKKEGLNDYLSKCLSSLSVGDWENDSFSDL